MIEWAIEDGDPVTEGVAVYSLETDKSVTVVATAGSTLRILVEIDETYDVGTLIDRID